MLRGLSSLLCNPRKALLMTAQDKKPGTDEIETGTILIEPSSGTGASIEQEADAFLGEEAAKPAEPKNAIALGIGLMLLGVILFVMNDVMGKWLVATYTVGQVLLIRSLFGLVMLAPSIYRAGVAPILKPAEPGLQAIRAIMTTIEVACFYWAVSYLPLADVVTFYMATPIFVTALAAPMLGEKIEWQRMVAVLIGFCGVIVAMRPSSATFSLPAFIAIFGCFIFSLTMIITRRLRDSKGITLVTWQTSAALIGGGIVAPFQWVQPTLRDFLLLGMLGVVATLAHMAVNKSLKLAPASVVMPYQYTQIVWAVILGYLVFSDWPDPAMFVGSCIIVGAGLFIFFREQAKKPA